MTPRKAPSAARSRNTEPLNFRVAPEFKKRFKLRALDADLKMNELLNQALAAWEEKHGIKAKR